MDKFVLHHGVAAPLLRINIDTDAIIPSREMKQVAKTGLAQGLFAAWRYLEPGGRTPNPDFVLNQPGFASATILLAGANFGCGSSREHAVWALREYGFRVVIAPSFGAIFYNNCIRNGLLPVQLSDSVVQQLAQIGAAGVVTVDLQNCRVSGADGVQFAFVIAPESREMLLEGLDPVALTLKLKDRIEAFQLVDRARRPWVYLTSSGTQTGPPGQHVAS